MKKVIYQREKKTKVVNSSYFEVVNSILMDGWTKRSTSLHCLAHSLDLR